MGRKSADITITADGRDLGKTFRVTEMSAVDGEEWAAYALNAMARAGTPLPDEVQQAGMAAVGALVFSRMGGEGEAVSEEGQAARAAAIGGVVVRLLAGVAWFDLKHLMDQMMGCVQIVPPSGTPRPLLTGRTDTDDDIQEVATRLQLRGEVLSLHLGFSLAAEISKLRLLAATTSTSSTIPTSDGSSAPSSVRAKRRSKS